MKLHLGLIPAVLILMAGTGAAFAQSEAADKFDCGQWGKVGPITWNEKGTAVFDFGKMKQVHMEKTPIQKGAYMAAGRDLFEAIDKACGGK